MKYQVFVRNLEDRTFIASAVGSIDIIANGVTEKEAIDILTKILAAGVY